MAFGYTPINIGIPPLLNKISDGVSFVSLLVADAVIFARMLHVVTIDNPSQTPKATAVPWGIFEGSNQVIFPDSIVSINVDRDWDLPDYPMEQGAFQTYNKVTKPKDLRVRMSFSGTELQINNFLQTLDDLAGQTNLYSVVTKGKTYLNMNIKHYDFKRTAENGASLLVVDVRFQEIRNTVSATFSNTKLPDGSTQTANNTKSLPGNVLASSLKAT